MPICARIVRAHMDRLVGAEIRRSVCCLILGFFLAKINVPFPVIMAILLYAKRNMPSTNIL